MIEEAPSVALARRSNRSLLEAYDFGRFGNVVDVGGGRGAFLDALLEAHPHMHGVLFDLPHVIATCEDASADVAPRRRAVAGSFFEGVPEGGEAYVLRAVLHDWADDEAVAILRTCRGAMTDDAVLLVIERDLGPANELPEAKLSDLNMLVGPGGRERAIEEYVALFDSAGFRFHASTPSPKRRESPGQRAQLAQRQESYVPMISNSLFSRMSSEEDPTITLNVPGSRTKRMLRSHSARSSGMSVKVSVLISPGFKWAR